MQTRVIVYVDGFNLYHAIDHLRRPHLKWLDLYKLSRGLLRPGEHLEAVKYFSAFATWLPQAVIRHRIYVAALKASGATIILGQFKSKPRHCRRCGSSWQGHEEKETDVHIATHMLSDALNGDVERIILISADTDLSPPIRMIAAQRPHVEVFVAAPPRRFGQCRALGPQLELSSNRLADSLLPAAIVTKAGRTITRPVTYEPPPD